MGGEQGKNINSLNSNNNKNKIKIVKDNKEKNSVSVIDSKIINPNKDNLSDRLIVINKQDLKTKEVIESLLKFYDNENEILIGTRSGNIIFADNIDKSHSDLSNISYIYKCKSLYSMAYFTKKDLFAVGTDESILLLKVENRNPKEIKCENEIKHSLGKINILLELSNGNFISASNSINLWEKEVDNYVTNHSFPKEDKNKIAIFNNLIEVKDKIIANQEATSKLFALNSNDLSLVYEKNKIHSIYYNGNLQKISDNYIILIGKFELKIIDIRIGSVCTKIPTLGKGNLLNITQKWDENDDWIVTELFGNYIDIYKQENNDFIYKERLSCSGNKYKLGWNTKLLSIGKNKFVSGDYNGNINVLMVK